MRNPWTLLKENADPIGALATIVGFALTVWQLNEAGTALRASNSYQIQKDSRDLIASLLDDREFRDYVDGKTPISTRSQEKLWLMFSFYRSIFRQDEVGGLLDEYAQGIRDEFCGFLKNPPIKAGWDKLLSENRIGEGHVQMHATWCPVKN